MREIIMTPSANIVKISARKTHIFFLPFLITQGAKVELQSFVFFFYFKVIQSVNRLFFFPNLNKKGKRKCHSVLTCDETVSVLVVPFLFFLDLYV